MNQWVSMWGNAVSIAEHRPEGYAKDITLRYPIYVPFDGEALRFTFDNTILSNKKTSIYALNEIILEETKWAEEANKQREEYRKYLEQQEEQLKKEAFLFHIFGFFWIIGLIPLIIFIYKKYDKEHTSVFKGK